MTNNELHKQLSVELSNVNDTLQTLRDGVTGDSEAIVNEMLKAVRFLEQKSFDLSNQEDVYKS